MFWVSGFFVSDVTSGVGLHLFTEGIGTWASITRCNYLTPVFSRNWAEIHSFEPQISFLTFLMATKPKFGYK